MPSTEQLLSRSFDTLPLGAITPKGWLRRQLEIQANGLSGHLDESHENLSDSTWLGGEKWGHEQGPYYADGLVPLAHLLDDEQLLVKAEKWIDGFLDSQVEHGFIGPINGEWRPPYYPLDPWPCYVVLKVFVQHYEATGDDRVLDAMLEFARFLWETIDDRPLYSWSKFRYGDLLISLHWLFERTDEDWLLDLADEVATQGFDWTGHWTTFDLTEPIGEGDAPKGGDRFLEERHHHHVVTNAMGIKTPGVLYRQTGDERDRAAVYQAIENLDEHHGQVTGVFTGDEHFAGKNPSRGTETCSVVEYLFDLEQLVAILGDPSFGDRLERIAYNALPAAFTPNMWAHQYDQQVNQVCCTRAERPWSNGEDANLFGSDHFCCTTNFHQGWPKFAASLWMRTDEGLAAVAYAPCEVSTEVAGTAVTLRESTAYPFDETVTIRVDPETPTTFPLEFRIPEWTADDATVDLPDAETQTPKPGTFHTVRREWHPGDTVELEFPMPVAAEKRYNGAVALRRGPLVYAMPVDAEWTAVGGSPPRETFEVRPTEAWNYGVDVDVSAPTRSVEVRRGTVGETPFAPDDAPIELLVDGRRVPEWGLEDNWAGPIPADPSTDEPRERLRLIPYGCTNLRVTEFPHLDGE